jgi:hypothetical protein
VAVEGVEQAAKPVAEAAPAERGQAQVVAVLDRVVQDPVVQDPAVQDPAVHPAMARRKNATAGGKI